MGAATGDGRVPTATSPRRDGPAAAQGFPVRPGVGDSAVADGTHVSTFNRRPGQDAPDARWGEKRLAEVGNGRLYRGLLLYPPWLGPQEVPQSPKKMAAA